MQRLVKVQPIGATLHVHQCGCYELQRRRYYLLQVWELCSLNIAHDNSIVFDCRFLCHAEFEVDCVYHIPIVFHVHILIANGMSLQSIRSQEL